MPSTDSQSLADQSACYICAGVSITEGFILSLLASVSARGISHATQYIVTSSDYAPVAGASVTITAQLADAQGNAVQTAGRTVTWSKTGSDASFSAPTSVTNASGIATVTLTTDFANVAHVITATDAQGKTGNSAAVTSVVGPYTAAWAASVVTNGGSNPTPLEQASADRYYRRCIAAGLETLIYSEILIISSSLIGAATPFLFINTGGALWVNTGNRFVIGDLTINGLLGNGVDKQLTTVIVPSDALTSTSAGLVAYCQKSPTIGSGYALGCSDAQNSNHFALLGLVASSTAYCWRFINSGTDFTTGTSATGFLSMQRTANNLLKLYWANSTNTFAAIGTASNAQTGAVTTTNAIWMFNANVSGGGTIPSDYRMSYAAITLGMTATQVQAHYNAVVQFRTDLGGGLV